MRAWPARAVSCPAPMPATCATRPAIRFSPTPSQANRTGNGSGDRCDQSEFQRRAGFVEARLCPHRHGHDFLSICAAALRGREAAGRLVSVGTDMYPCPCHGGTACADCGAVPGRHVASVDLWTWHGRPWRFDDRAAFFRSFRGRFGLRADRRAEPGAMGQNSFVRNFWDRLVVTPACAADHAALAFHQIGDSNHTSASTHSRPNRGANYDRLI